MAIRDDGARSTRTVRRVGLALGLLGLVGVGARFAAVLHAHRKRVRSGSREIESRFGRIEFATTGAGSPVLVVHGAGGGFDQVTALAEPLVAAGHLVIAPSRFGYLRSSSPSDPSLDDQADAFAAVLDDLGIACLPVVGISLGALSAMQFAVRHPHRCRSLTLIVPAASAVGDALPSQGPLPEQGPLAKAVAERVMTSDFLYWLAITMARRTMIRSVLGTDPALVAAASAAERRRAHALLENVLPISERVLGFRIDARLAATSQSIAIDRIATPTLVVSLEDDFYRTLGPARFIAATIPGARLLTYPSGGHIWIGHDAELLAEVDAFLRRT